VTSALARDEQCRGEVRSLAALRRLYAALTAREREVMAFVASGLMNKQIAAAMNLSEITVKIHRGQAMKKMESRSLADFVRKAEALGITEPGDTAVPAKIRSN
jgi:FixJ family two-component response regulator